jgi:hypothetical protein
MTNVYQGPNSCYAKYEGTYAPGRGVNAFTVRFLVGLILRDLKRGWTYERGTCRKIKMTPKLAIKRLLFLLKLARKHAPAHLPAVKREVMRAIRYVKKNARAVAAV